MPKIWQEDKHKVIATLTSSGSGANRPAGQGNEQDYVIIDPETNRPRLTTQIEHARLQGVPDSWTKGFSRAAWAFINGNGVTTTVATYLGKRITVAYDCIVDES